MSCWDAYNDDHELPPVGECKECECDVDANGDTTLECCGYSPKCATCGYAPCDHSR